ncbi:MAG: hypothetical protein CR974_00855 [Gammaproteobacteria bacterium]|nr:MAG: hypothetical protein CR974_00855 [Gammaproteobacteria bacterium]
MKTVVLLTGLMVGLTHAEVCQPPKPFRLLDSEAAQIFQRNTLLPAVATKTPANATDAGADVADLPRLVNLWASWCAPCRKELPYLQRVSLTKKAEVHLLNIEDEPEEAEKVLTDINIDALTTRYAKMELLDELNIQGLPASVVFHQQNIYLGVGVLKQEAHIDDWLDCLNKK